MFVSNQRPEIFFSCRIESLKVERFMQDYFTLHIIIIYAKLSLEQNFKKLNKIS